MQREVSVQAERRASWDLYKIPLKKKERQADAKIEERDGAYFDLGAQLK